MKRLLIAAALLLSLAACKKDEPSGCYTCTFGIDSNGNRPPAKTWCGDPAAQFYDSNGMPLTSTCTR